MLALGQRRLIIIAAVVLTTVAAVVGGGYLLSAPEMEVAYVGLAPQDVSRIGRALSEAGMAFDVSSDSTRLMTRRGETAKVRAYLAERGLPNTPGTGYELFDKVGPLGLTSFMQEVTRARVLEGEIARTLQILKGVRAARVHLALGESSSFLRPRQPASASVVVRTELSGDGSQTEAIRHIVVAAVPGLVLANVRVISADGRVLSAGGDSTSDASERLLSLEKSVSQDIQSKISRTLIAHLGADNFEASVAVHLNIDKRQVNETTFAPENRVERSTRVVKELGNSQNGSARTNVSVEQNIPSDSSANSGSEQSRKSNQKRDEVTNYEVGSRITAVTSDGYRIERLSVAVVVNSKRIADATSSADLPGVAATKISEIERLVGSAAGIDTKRGDQVTVAVVDFSANGNLPSSVIDGSENGLFLVRNFSLLSKVGTILIVTTMLIFLGIRPATKALAGPARLTHQLDAATPMDKMQLAGR